MTAIYTLHAPITGRRPIRSGTSADQPVALGSAILTSDAGPLCACRSPSPVDLQPCNDSVEPAIPLDAPSRLGFSADDVLNALDLAPQTVTVSSRTGGASSRTFELTFTPDVAAVVTRNPAVARTFRRARASGSAARSR